MSGGFGVLVGYIFAFLVLITVFISALSTYNEQISEQQRILDSFEKKMTSNLNYDYEFTLPYYASGRVTYILENGEKKLLYKKENGDFCFSFFVDQNYVSSNDRLFVNFEDEELTQTFRYLDENSQALFSFRSSIDITTETIVKTQSCEQINKVYYITSSNINWWNSSFEKRKIITVNNVANEAIVEYQIPIVLNNTNFNFAEGREDEIRFALPIKENYALDLPFDESSQTQLEYSKYSNTAYLGTDSSSESSDPTFTNSGIILSAFDFDGTDDRVTISASTSLQLNKSLTYSAWIKWDASGNINQYIFTNGADNNSISIINDGGVNDNKVNFKLNIAGTNRNIISNTTIDTNWHLVSATFDGYNMNFYIDKNLVGTATYLGDVIGVSAINYIGTNSTAGTYFNGIIDEVKIFNFALNQSEVEKLYYNNLRFKELDFYVSNWDPALDKAKVFVKVPYVHANSNMSFDMYYFSKEDLNSSSNIETTFSYTAPRTVGYVVSGGADNNGLTISSLYDNNVIYVDTDVFNLDHSQSSTLNGANTFANDTIKMKYLAQVEGTGGGGDIVVPISWAGTNFTFTNTLNSQDRFCFIAPYSNTVVTLYSNGVLITTLNVNTMTNGVCDNRALVAANNIYINSSSPILVFYSRANAFTQYALPLLPASSDDWYGVGSSALYITALPSGSSTFWINSNGVSGSSTLTGANRLALTAQGNAGTAPAFKIMNSNRVYVSQYNDGDGNERVTFAPASEFGKRFGSGIAMDYLALVSQYSNANCSLYDSTDVLIENVPTGTGQNGVYKYGFNVGNTNVYANANWYLTCDKSVWPYFESNAENERNLFGHLQMRQYIYPEPTVSIS